MVTGASSGIGDATVRLFRRHGWDVVGVARREERLRALAADTGADVFVADLTDQTQVDALRDHVAGLGPVHALVNVAGGAFGTASVEESDPADWQRMFDLNVIATKRMVTAMLPLLRAAVSAETVGSGDVPHADILTVTSTAGHVGYEGGGGYNAAKFAEHALVEVLRLELAGEPIRVLEVAPGLVKTDEFSVVRYGGDREKAEAVYAGVEHPLSAADVAQTIVATLELPGHVNLDLVTMRPVAQAAAHKLVRQPLRPRT
ncbi:SDR family oxidoreductase [Parafrigoribacterium mesophilum]|uniref:SDR family oxidoreductase n=1 Tax=Parafrigoribacterium mesophilum TaxID=433646 RepID=UPI0031FC4F70